MNAKQRKQLIKIAEKIYDLASEIDHLRGRTARDDGRRAGEIRQYARRVAGVRKGLQDVRGNRSP